MCHYVKAFAWLSPEPPLLSRDKYTSTLAFIYAFQAKLGFPKAFELSPPAQTFLKLMGLA